MFRNAPLLKQLLRQGFEITLIGKDLNALWNLTGDVCGVIEVAAFVNRSGRFMLCSRPFLPPRMFRGELDSCRVCFDHIDTSVEPRTRRVQIAYRNLTINLSLPLSDQSTEKTLYCSEAMTFLSLPRETSLLQFMSHVLPQASLH